MSGSLPTHMQFELAGGRNSRSSSPDRKLHPLTVEAWLSNLGLSELLPFFSHYRFVQDLLNLTELDLRDHFGIKNGAHRARLVSSLVIIREAQHNQRPGTPSKCRNFNTTEPLYPATSSSPCRAYLDNRNNQSPSMDYDVPRPSHSSATMGLYSVTKNAATRDISVNAWYHGPISRLTAEELVHNNGDFLIRDSSTQPGDYVLTVKWNGLPLHFVVNRRTVVDCDVAGNSVQRSVYHFEEDAFDSVAELLHHYLKCRKPVTEVTGALISFGVPCHNSLREFHSLPKYGSQPLLNSSIGFQTPDESTQSLERRSSVPSLAKMTAVDISIDESRQQLQCASGVTMSNSHQRTGSESHLISAAVESSLCGAINIPTESTASRSESDADASHPPPPKPSRVPTVKVTKSQTCKRPLVPIRNQALYDDDGKDYSDYDQVKCWPGNQASSTGLLFGIASLFADITQHESQFLTPDNRPLEPSAITLMKSMVFDTPASALARHLTLIDLKLLKTSDPADIDSAYPTCLELISLPQGHFLRQDVIERFHCLRLLVSVLILKCSNANERVRMLHIWVETAAELQSTTYGNMFSFSAVMSALLSNSISRLNTLWLQLRQQFSASSAVFENKLCSLQHAIDTASREMTAGKQRHVTVPNIFPLAELLEGTVIGNTGSGVGHSLHWSDVDGLLAHLELARAIMAESKLYQMKAAALQALHNCNVSVDSALVDMLSTPTHMRLLWGVRGVGVERSERLAKFELVISALSDKIEHGLK